MDSIKTKTLIWIFAVIGILLAVYSLSNSVDYNKIFGLNKYLIENQKQTDSLLNDIKLREMQLSKKIDSFELSINQQQRKIDNKIKNLIRYEKQIDNYTDSDFDKRFRIFSNLIKKDSTR